MKKRQRENAVISYTLIAIFIIISAGIINAGFIYYLNYKAHYKIDVEDQLSAIGRLKTAGLVHWREDCLEDSKVFYNNTSFSKMVGRYMNNPGDANTQEQVKEWLSRTQMAYQYDKLMLLDNQYHKKIIIPDGTEQPDSYVSKDSSELLRLGQVAFEDFYWNEENQKAYLKVLVPILAEDSGKMIGIVAIRIDPKKYLYPFIVKWPIPSMTAETLLVRKKGKDVQFLNELKFKKETALQMERSVANHDLPAVKAVLGHKGIVEGIDYRGKGVVADVQAVPDSPWFLITKIDESEIYESLYKAKWAIIIFIGSLLTGIGTSIGFLCKRQSAVLYHKKYHESKEWNITFDAIKDMISVTGKDTRLRTVNKAFADVFGKTPEELIGKRCCELMHQTKEPPANCPMRKTFATKQPASVEIYYEPLRKHLEISTYPVLDEDGEIDEVVHFIRDITKRKLMEEGRRRTDVQLRDSLRFNEEVISNASVGVVVYDTQLRYVEWNAFMEEMTGMKKKDVIGKNALELFPHLKKQGIDKLLRDALNGETASSPDTEYHCPKTGKSGWVLGTYTPHRNSTGRILGVIGIIRDITERRQAEEYFKNNEMRFRGLFENMSSAVAVYKAENDGEDFIFADCNQALLDIEKINKEHIIGKRVTEVFPNVKEFGIFEVFQRVYRTGVAEDFPLALYKDDRVSGWKENHIYKLPSGEVVSIYDDITERKLAEESLKESDNMFRSIATAVPVGLGIASDRNIQWVNDYLLQLIGYKKEEIVGNDSRIFYADDAGYNLVGDKYYKELREKGKAEIEVNWKHKNGTVLNILLTGAALNKQDLSQGIIFAALDITERKQYQEELHHAAAN